MQTYFKIFVLSISFFIIPDMLTAGEEQDVVLFEQLKTVDRNIPLTEKNQDRAIQAKLIRILKSSGKFSNINITVSEGLVRINAIAQSLQYVNWPTEVAQNIDGVIGVVSDDPQRILTSWIFHFLKVNLLILVNQH